MSESFYSVYLWEDSVCADLSFIIHDTIPDKILCERVCEDVLRQRLKDPYPDDTCHVLAIQSKSNGEVKTFCTWAEADYLASELLRHFGID
jgi:hypothetical protein